MNTIRTGLLGLAALLLSASCGNSDDNKVATATVTGGRAALAGAAGATAGGGATSTGGKAATGGTAGGGAGGAATGGTGGVLNAADTCAAVCDLLASATNPLTCIPNPCPGTCVSEYNNLVAADQQIATGPVCAAAYLDLLNCGLGQPADLWVCFTIPQTTTTIPLPPYAQTTDPCYVQSQTLYLAILGNNPCLAAFTAP